MASLVDRAERPAGGRPGAVPLAPLSPGPGPGSRGPPAPCPGPGSGSAGPAGVPGRARSACSTVPLKLCRPTTYLCFPAPPTGPDARAPAHARGAGGPGGVRGLRGAGAGPRGRSAAREPGPSRGSRRAPSLPRRVGAPDLGFVHFHARPVRAAMGARAGLAGARGEREEGATRAAESPRVPQPDAETTAPRSQTVCPVGASGLSTSPGEVRGAGVPLRGLRRGSTTEPGTDDGSGCPMSGLEVHVLRFRLFVHLLGERFQRHVLGPSPRRGICRRRPPLRARAVPARPRSPDARLTRVGRDAEPAGRCAPVSRARRWYHSGPTAAAVAAHSGPLTGSDPRRWSFGPTRWHLGTFAPGPRARADRPPTSDVIRVGGLRHSRSGSRRRRLHRREQPAGSTERRGRSLGARSLARGPSS